MADEKLGIGETVKRICDNIINAQAALDLIEKRLREAGTLEMYPALPTRVAWETRDGGEGTYLQVYFGKDRATGQYKGPGAKRKVYVGCKAERVAHAMTMIENRKAWIRIDELRAGLAMWIEQRTRQVDGLHSRARNLLSDYPRALTTPPALDVTVTGKRIEAE